MQHAVLKSLAAAGTLALAIAACSSSGTPSGSGNAASNKTLVIESSSVTAPSQNFNPYVQSATGYSAQATGLIYEPLYIFNVMNPTSAAGAHAGFRPADLVQRRQDADRPDPLGREVERRQAVHRERRRLHLQPGQEEPDALHRERAAGDERDRDQPDLGHAQLLLGAVRQPVPHRAGLHRAAARLGLGQQPGHLHRRQPGRHRAVHAADLLLARLPAQAEPELPGQEHGQGNGRGLPVLQQQRQPGAADRQRPDRLGRQQPGARHQLELPEQEQREHHRLDSQPYFAANTEVTLWFTSPRRR
jgi:hypothetical protein